jgi:hypothetical protein
MQLFQLKGVVERRSLLNAYVTLTEISELFRKLVTVYGGGVNVAESRGSNLHTA